MKNRAARLRSAHGNSRLAEGAGRGSPMISLGKSER